MTKGLDYPLRSIFPWRRNPKGEVGIEIEIEGGPWPDDVPTNWDRHEDGSLRGNGIEYVLRQPVARERVRPALETLQKALRDARLSFSHRTSVHVHINVQDMTVRQWSSFIVLYTIFEELLVRQVGPARDGNRFCLRAKDAEQNLEVVREALLTSHVGAIGQYDIKYAAMNILATSTHGTLEFRAMEGNLDIDRIDNWVQMLLHLKGVAMKLSSPRLCAEDLSRFGPIEWARRVLPAGNPMTLRLLRDPEVIDSMYEGVRLAQDICYEVDWPDAPETAENKSESTSTTAQLFFEPGGVRVQDLPIAIAGRNPWEQLREIR